MLVGPLDDLNSKSNSRYLINCSLKYFANYGGGDFFLCKGCIANMEIVETPIYSQKKSLCIYLFDLLSSCMILRSTQLRHLMVSTIRSEKG